MSETARATDAILVVRLGAMGDILHALPAAASLKLSCPSRPLAWLVEPVWIPLLQGNPYIDRIIPLDTRRLATWTAVHRELGQWQFGAAIDFQGLIKSAVAARLAKPRRLFGFSRSEARESMAALLYTDPVSSLSVHRVDRALDLAAAAGATVLTQESPIPPGEPEGDLPDGPFILTSPFAGWGSKQWPAESFDQLGDILLQEAGIPLVVNAAPGASMTFRHARPHFSGLAGLIHATRRASAVVGVDSGPMHLAAALRKPGVAIFGPTDPAINGPYGGTLLVLRQPNAPTTYKRDAAIAGSMRAITPRQVWSKLREVTSKC